MIYRAVKNRYTGESFTASNTLKVSVVERVNGKAEMAWHLRTVVCKVLLLVQVILN